MQHILSTGTAFLDATGEACGTITPLIKRALARLQPGEVLEVLTHDPAARMGVPAWCRLTGHELLDSRVDGDQDTYFRIRVKPHPSQPA